MGDDEFNPGDLVECFYFGHASGPGFEGEPIRTFSGVVVRGPYKWQWPDSGHREFRYPVSHTAYDILVCGDVMEGVDCNSLRHLQHGPKIKEKNTVKD